MMVPAAEHDTAVNVRFSDTKRFLSRYPVCPGDLSQSSVSQAAHRPLSLGPQAGKWVSGANSRRPILALCKGSHY